MKLDTQNQARTLWSWATGIDDIRLWQSFVIGGATCLGLSFFNTSSTIRELSILAATSLSGAAAITRLVPRSIQEQDAYKLAVITEAGREHFAREASPGRTDFMGAFDVPTDSLVAPFKLENVGFDNFDKIPHIILLAETGCGKSTLLKAMLDKMPGDVIIADCHATKKSWAGFEVVGRPTALHELSRLMQGAFDEMERRYKIRDDYDADDYSKIAHPINIVIEEAPAAKNNIDSELWKTIVAELARQARKVRIRLILITQGETISALNLGGMSEIKENFCLIRGGNFAKRHAKGIKNDDLFNWLSIQDRPWTVNDFGFSVANLADYQAQPRLELHEDTKRILEYVRQEKHQPTIQDKPKTNEVMEVKPKPITLEKTDNLEAISLEDLCAKILAFCGDKKKITVRDVQRKKDIGQRYKLSVAAIDGIFIDLANQGKVERVDASSKGSISIKIL